ncbi:N,N-dimethylformamidase beta subunit family domain-containing protein [Nocardioides panacis]
MRSTPGPPSTRTGLWREGVEPHAEHGLTGMDYECFPVDAPFRVASPGWWGFAGTGTRRGEELHHLVGVEADRVYPVRGTPRPLQVLAHAPYSCRGVPTSAQAVYYTTPSGAAVLDVGTLRWTCALADRCPVPLTRRTLRFVNRVTATVLRDFALGPAAPRHPARDNVRQFDLPTTNLVPAS